MINAKEMCNLSVANTENNPILTEIENKCKEAAKHNKFFTELFSVEDKYTDLNMLIIKHYNIDVFRALQRMGYIFACDAEHETKHIIIGWGYSSSQELVSDLKRNI